MTAKPGLLGALPGMTGDGTPPIHGNFQMMMGLNESMEDQLRNVMQEAAFVGGKIEGHLWTYNILII